MTSSLGGGAIWGDSMIRRAALFCALVAAMGLVASGVANAASCTINGGDEYTNSPDVEVSFSAYGATQYRISNSFYSLGDWRDIGWSSTVVWKLPALDDGVKAVFIGFRDGPDDEHPGDCHDGIFLDTTPPLTTAEDDAPSYEWVKRVEVSLSVRESGSGVERTEYAFSASGPWTK
jgi:hypothetical protein